MESYSKDGIEITREVAATAEDVFKVLSEAESFSQWFGEPQLPYHWRL